MTAATLRNLAEDYVGRYGGPSANLRRVLVRHARKDGSDGRQWTTHIEGIIAEFLAAGALDDGRYAEVAARSLTDRGVAPRMVQFRLRQKGIEAADIDAALEQLGDRRDAEWTAALRYAERRRLGPYRKPEERKERRQKDAAAIARAGFSVSVAFRVVDLKFTDD